MAVIGVELEIDTLVLTRGRDFQWTFENVEGDYPAGELFFEFPDLIEDGEPKRWDFTIDGDTATIKVESDEVDTVPARTKFHLVFLPDGEEAGGDAIAIGQVVVQG